MRIKINTPDQFEHKNMWIVFGFTSVLLVGGIIVAFVMSNGQLDVAWHALKEFLNETKQDGDLRGYLGFILLLGVICIGPFASLASIIHYSRKIKGQARFTFLDFARDHFTLENADPAFSFSSPYDKLSFTLVINTYIRRGPKGAAHRCLDAIALIFTTKDGQTHIIKHVGKLDFIQKMLDVAPRFSSFSYEVRALYESLDADEKDLVQYIKDQIRNYRSYGKMLRFSDRQRKQVRWVGYMLIGAAVGLLFLTYEMICELTKNAFKPDWLALVWLGFIFVPFGVLVGLGTRMCYLVHQDAKLAKELINAPRK